MSSKLDIKSLLEESSGLIMWAFVLIQCWVHIEKLIWLGKKAGSGKSTWLRKTRPEEAVPATAQESTLWNHHGVGGTSKFQNYRWYVAAYWSLPNRTASALHGLCLKEAESREASSPATQELFFWTANSLPAWNCPSWLQLFSFFKKSVYSWALKLWEQWKGLSKSAVKL